MNRLKPIIATLCIALGLVACEKEIPFKGEVAKRKLVLNADFTPDSVWKVNLSHSLSIGDTGQPGPVTNGVVRIKDAAGQTIATLDHSQGGIYTSGSLTPASGVNYTVEAEAAGYDMISATSSAPEAVSISLADTSFGTFLGQDVLNVSITINDPADPEDYYVIDVTGSFYDSTGLADQFPLWSFSLDPNTDNSELGDENSSYRRLYLKDDGFNGQAYKTTFFTESYLLSYLEDGTFDRLEVNARVRSVSKDLYLYLKSYDKYENYSFDPTFSQPVQVFSNVEKGFGIFGGYSSANLTFIYE